MTLIIDMVTGEILEDDRPGEREPEESGAERPAPPHYGPRPEVVPVTPERRPEPPPPPPYWGP